MNNKDEVFAANQNSSTSSFLHVIFRNDCDAISEANIQSRLLSPISLLLY